MLVAALGIGLLAAYFLGLRPGAYAALATAVVLIGAQLFPGLAMAAYLIVGAGAFGLFTFGPRLRKPTPLETRASRALAGARGLAGRLARRWSAKGPRGSA